MFTGKYLVQYLVDGEVITAVKNAQEVIELYGYSDYNGCDNLTIWALTKIIGHFVSVMVRHDYNEVVDDFGHIDIHCKIVDDVGVEYGYGHYEDH